MVSYSRISRCLPNVNFFTGTLEGILPVSWDYRFWLCVFVMCHACLERIYTQFSECMELLARNRRDIWNLTDCKKTWTQSHLVRERTLNHLAKLFGDSSPIAVTYWVWCYLFCIILRRRELSVWMILLKCWKWS